jgi:hypothetical protein
MFPYSALTIVDTQHFQFGNENISFDMTNEINSILTGQLTNVTGWGIAYLPQVENLTGLTENYEVQFFTRHTQTFYEPFLETNYDDLIEDDRNSFSLGKVNKLYLYLYEDGNPINLDSLPSVSISDANGTPILGLSTPYLDVRQRTKGVYEVTIPPLIGYQTPCSFYDIWSGLTLNGFSLPNVTNSFTIHPLKKSIQIGTTTSWSQTKRASQLRYGPLLYYGGGSIEHFTFFVNKEKWLFSLFFANMALICCKHSNYLLNNHFGIGV